MTALAQYAWRLESARRSLWADWMATREGSPRDKLEPVSAMLADEFTALAMPKLPQFRCYHPERLR